MQLHSRFWRSVAPFMIVTLLVGSLAQLFVAQPVQANTSGVLTPEENAFFGFNAGNCPAAYPAFGLCRGGGILNSGFTAVLPGTNAANQANLNFNNAGTGTLRITSTTGDAYQGTAAKQDNALAVPFDASRRPFSVGTRLLPPFNIDRNFQSGGVMLGLDENNYVKLVMAYNDFGGGGNRRGIQFAVETNNVFAANAGSLPLPTVTTSLDLFLSGDPTTNTIRALYRIDSDDVEDIVEIGTQFVDAKFFAELAYGGLITTSFSAPSNPFTYNFDWFKIGEYVRPGASSSGISFTGPTRVIDRPGTQALNPATVFANPTTLAFGPDGRLYVGTYRGRIYSYALGPGNSPTDVRVYEQIYNRPNRTCPSSSSDPIVPPIGQVCTLDPAVIGRQVLGISFSPNATPTNIELYVTHSDPRFTKNQSIDSTVAKRIDTNSGILSRLTLNGAGAVTADEDLITGLPRSREFHSINGLDFDDAGWLYISVGGNTNTGSPSSFFSFLPEFFFSASVVRVRPADLVAPLDVRSFTSPADLDPYTGVFELFGTGLRNAYDIVWHSSGRLYANTNGSNGGLGTTPGPANGCPNGVAVGISTQADSLDWVRSNTYHGHPNPARNECVWGNGNYPGGTTLTPEANYEAPVYLYSGAQSVNGIAEYTAPTFSGQMQGDLIVAAYAGTESVRRLVLASDGESVLSDQILTQALSTPLDVTVAANGAIFIADLGTVSSSDNAASPGGIYILTANDTGGTATTCRSAGVDPALADSDGDGFLDQDEIDNGTDICNASSQPIDSNGVLVNAILTGGYLLSDFHDPDIDGDGILNAEEQLQFDSANGIATPLPLNIDFAGDGDGIQKTGFYGVLLRDNPGATLSALEGRGFGLYEPTARLRANGVSGALGLLATDGSQRGPSNDQDNFLQVGFNAATQPFTITTEIGSPFTGESATVATPEEAGIYFGQDADNYVQLSLRRTVANQATFSFAAEAGGGLSAGLGQTATPTLALPFTGTIRLALVGHPAAGYLAARYSIVPPGLGEQPTPWTTIAVLHDVNFSSLAGYFIEPGCSPTSGAGCVAVAGLATTGPDLAYGFTEFRIDPFTNALGGRAVAGFAAERPAPTTGPVDLSWATNGQALISGFHIYRGTSDNRAAATRMTASPIAPTGDPLRSQSYSYSDASAPVNPVYYWLEPQIVGGTTGSELSTTLNEKANQTITFAVLADVTFGVAPITLSATATSGLPVSFSGTGACSVNGTTLTIDGAGACEVTATQAGNATFNAAPIVTRSFAIAKAAATVAVTSTTRTFDGTNPPVSATTDPSGLGLTVSYVGTGATNYGPSTIPPTNVGEYAVVATINATNYQGSAVGDLVITPATAQIVLTNLTQGYTGAARSVTVTTIPASLAVSVVYQGTDGTTYGPSATAPTEVGRYTVAVDIAASETNYTGTATATLAIIASQSTISIASPTVTFNGTPQTVTVTTTPPGLPFTLSYNGVGGTSYGPSSTPPTNAGSYIVRATVTESNYAGTASGTLTILRAQAELMISGLSVVANGTPRPVTVTTSPAGLSGVIVTYTGVGSTTYGPSTTPPTNAGTYRVAVELNHPNYDAAVTRELRITEPVPAENRFTVFLPILRR